MNFDWSSAIYIIINFSLRKEVLHDAYSIPSQLRILSLWLPSQPLNAFLQILTQIAIFLSQRIQLFTLFRVRFI